MRISSKICNNKDETKRLQLSVSLIWLRFMHMPCTCICHMHSLYTTVCVWLYSHWSDDSICRELCKNGSTDRDTVWDVDSGGPKEPCTRWGPDPLCERAILGKGAAHCNGKNSNVYKSKMADNRHVNKSSAVAEMGDRARAKLAEKWGLLCPVPRSVEGSWVPI